MMSDIVSLVPTLRAQALIQAEGDAVRADAIVEDALLYALAHLEQIPREEAEVRDWFIGLVVMCVERDRPIPV